MSDPITIPQWWPETRHGWPTDDEGNPSGSAWQRQTLLEVDAIDWPASGISAAELSRPYGEIDTGAGSFATFVPTMGELLDQFVRIMRPPAEGEGKNPIPVWYGVILSVAEEWDGKNTASATGREVYTARGLEILLARAGVTGSMVVSGAEAVEISEVLPFNLRTRQGGLLLGNRSPGRFTGFHGGSAYVFSDSANAGTWTGQQILEYLLAFYAPGPMAWSLAGQYANLAAWQSTLPPPENVLAAIAAIADRRRGHGWRVSVGDSGGAQLRICALFGDALTTAGGTKLSAASPQAAVDLDAAEISAPPILRWDATHQYDRIEARGEQMVLMGTVGFADETLKAGWSAGAEAGYKAASAVNRQREMYGHVFRCFKVDTDNLPAGPALSREGRVIGGTPATFYAGRSLLSHLPVTVADQSADTDGPVEYAPPLVLLKGTLKKGDLETEIYAPADRPLHPNGPAAGLSLRMLDGELGFRLGGKWNHYLAKAHFAGALEDPNPPIFDYEDILATVAWTSTERLTVTEDLETVRGGEFPRVLRIDVPECECWVRLAGTITDLGTDGQPIRSETIETLRNDRVKLAGVAAMAAAWYQRTRAALTIRYETLDTTFRPGDFVVSVFSAMQGAAEVNTPISRVSWRCRDGVTIVQTDFAELDFAEVGGFAGSGAVGMPRPALSAPAERDRLGSATVRDGLGGVPPRAGVARISSNDGGGAYHATELRWDTGTEAWVNSGAPTALAAQPAFSAFGEDGGRVGDKVLFWEVADVEDGETANLLYLGGNAWGGVFKAAGIRAHYSSDATEGNTTSAAFGKLENSLDMLVQITAELRYCTGHIETGSHPAYTSGDKAALSGLWGMVYTGAGMGWTDLVDAIMIRDAAGTQIFPDVWLEYRVTAGGNLEFRVRNETGGRISGVLYVTVWGVTIPPAQGNIEIGEYNCHEGSEWRSWGDGIWSW